MNTHSSFTFRPGFVLRFITGLSGTALALLISSSALAAGTDAEVNTAGAHAGLAAESENVEGVHTHLHHTLNCLVGPDGEGFNSDEMNPCADLGEGALTNANNDEMKEKLGKAAEHVNKGLATDDYEEAKKAARNAQKILEAR